MGSWPAWAAEGRLRSAAAWVARAARGRAAGMGSPLPHGGGCQLASAAAWPAWAAKGRLPSAASWPAWVAGWRFWFWIRMCEL